MVRAATAAASPENILTNMFPNPTKQYVSSPRHDPLNNSTEKTTTTPPNTSTQQQKHLPILIMKSKHDTQISPRDFSSQATSITSYTQSFGQKQPQGTCRTQDVSKSYASKAACKFSPA